MEQLSFTNIQKDQVINILGKIILTSGTLLISVGGFLFHKIYSAISKLEKKLEEAEEKREKKAEVHQKEIATINTMLAVISEKLATVAHDLHIMKTQEQGVLNAGLEQMRIMSENSCRQHDKFMELIQSLKYQKKQNERPRQTR